MTEIFIIYRASGSYEDYYQEPIKAVIDEAVAKRYCEKENQKLILVKKAWQNWQKDNPYQSKSFNPDSATDKQVQEEINYRVDRAQRAEAFEKITGKLDGETQYSYYSLELEGKL